VGGVHKKPSVVTLCCENESAWLEAGGRLRDENIIVRGHLGLMALEMLMKITAGGAETSGLRRAKRKNNILTHQNFCGFILPSSDCQLRLSFLTTI
jgi:hypothetical protein